VILSTCTHDGVSEDALTVGMIIVLISDFVNRNKAMIALLAIEVRDAKLRILDLKLALRVIKEGEVVRETSVTFATESWSVSNRCIFTRCILSG